jgi:protein-disulfide isomerase
VGGAERNARKRRQAQQAAAGSRGSHAGAKAVAKARGGGDNRKTVAVVVGVVLVAALIIGGVLWTNASKNATEGQQIPVAASQPFAAGVVEKRDGVVVTTGKPDAKKTIDVYADFLCPICGTFEAQYQDQIEQQINAGNLAVRYHMVPLLNTRSNPEGYSLESANAALAAADAGKFTAFHDSLFKTQPEEGKRGYDKAQLIQLGTSLGITDPKFAETINAGTYDAQLNAEFEKTTNDEALKQDFGQGPGFGTPTVAVNGKAIDRSGDWLNQVIAGQLG